MIKHLVYTSQSVAPITDEFLEDILRTARAFNEENGITGILLTAANGVFVQLLEGEPDTVAELFGKIEADPRHIGVLKLLDNKVDERVFPDWSMGFEDLSDCGSKSQFMAGRRLGQLMPVKAGSTNLSLIFTLSIYDANCGTHLSRFLLPGRSARGDRQAELMRR